VHPMAQVLFYKSTKKEEKQSQNKVLARMLTMALLDIDDQSRWDMTFTKLAEMHNEMGVKAVEYGIIGEIPFWTLKQCIGEEAFTVDVHMAWIQVMSRILKTMVPVALRFELEKGSGEIQQMRSKLSEGLAEQINARENSGEDGSVGPVNLMLYQSELNLIRIRKAAEGSINELQMQSQEKSQDRLRKQEEELSTTRNMLAKQEEAAMERKLQEAEEKMAIMMARLEHAQHSLSKAKLRPSEVTE
jgi:hemoglobin-like flavoprotein